MVRRAGGWCSDGSTSPVTRGVGSESTGPDTPPAVLDLMPRVKLIPSNAMPLFGPRITIFTKDGKSYTKQGTGREFIWDYDGLVGRIGARAI